MKTAIKKSDFCFSKMVDGFCTISYTSPTTSKQWIWDMAWISDGIVCKVINAENPTKSDLEKLKQWVKSKGKLNKYN